jgi:hypothetical protein
MQCSFQQSFHTALWLVQFHSVQLQSAFHNNSGISKRGWLTASS